MEAITIASAVQLMGLCHRKEFSHVLGSNQADQEEQKNEDALPLMGSQREQMQYKESFSLPWSKLTSNRLKKRTSFGLI